MRMGHHAKKVIAFGISWDMLTSVGCVVSLCMYGTGCSTSVSCKCTVHSQQRFVYMQSCRVLIPATVLRSQVIATLRVYKGPFTVSVAISVCDMVWVQCRLIGLFTVSVMLITAISIMLMLTLNLTLTVNGPLGCPRVFPR